METRDGTDGASGLDYHSPSEVLALSFSKIAALKVKG